MTQRAHEFEREIAGRRSSLAAEFWAFLKDNKKWWLLPIILVFMLVGALLVLGGTAAAPFIYTLF
jgi:hypothetical protein